MDLRLAADVQFIGKGCFSGKFAQVSQSIRRETATGARSQ